MSPIDVRLLPAEDLAYLEAVITKCAEAGVDPEAFLERLIRDNAPQPQLKLAHTGTELVEFVREALVKEAG